jgi:hypothetical protein
MQRNTARDSCSNSTYRDAQGVIARGHEDDRGLALELVQQIRQVAVFVLGRDKQVLLHQRLQINRTTSWARDENKTSRARDENKD